MIRTITPRAVIAGLVAIGVAPAGMAPALAQSAKPEGTITIVHGFTSALCQ
jgi:hypothetical protein